MEFRSDFIALRYWIDRQTPDFRFDGWWLETELNRRHKDFQSSALPTELSSPEVNILNLRNAVCARVYF